MLNYFRLHPSLYVSHGACLEGLLVAFDGPKRAGGSRLEVGDHEAGSVRKYGGHVTAAAVAGANGTLAAVAIGGGGFLAPQAACRPRGFGCAQPPWHPLLLWLASLSVSRRHMQSLRQSFGLLIVAAWCREVGPSVKVTNRGLPLQKGRIYAPVETKRTVRLRTHDLFCLVATKSLREEPTIHDGHTIGTVSNGFSVTFVQPVLGGAWLLGTGTVVFHNEK